MNLYTLLLTIFFLNYPLEICRSVSTKDKKQNRQAIRAASQQEEREKMLREISLKQKSSFLVPDIQIENNNNNIQTTDIIIDRIDISNKVNSNEFIDNNINSNNKVEHNQPCLNTKDPLNHALLSYWNNDLITSYTCTILAISTIKNSRNKNLALTIGYSLVTSKYFSIPNLNNGYI